MASRRRRKTYVFNTTGLPLSFNTAGQLLAPGQAREADPQDPITALYLDKGFLIVQEG